MKILINGIPSSGKTTIAYKLHLALEHLGYKTVLLDDEVIKRLDAKQIDTLVEYLDSPITIIVSCDSDIQADIKFWLDMPIKECQKRNDKKLEKEKAPKVGSYDNWDGYYSSGIKIKTYEEVVSELKKANLKF
jgi:thymidylate kinase